MFYETMTSFVVTLHTTTVIAHSAEADFFCYVLRTPTQKEMCSNDLLNQIEKGLFTTNSSQLSAQAANVQ